MRGWSAAPLRRLLLLALCVAGSMPWATALPAAGQTGPRLELTPASGRPGAEVVARGSGFTVSGTVSIYWNEVGTTGELAEGPLSRGTFTLTFRVPRAAPGDHRVLACARSGSAAACQQEASAPFVVDPASSTTTTAGSTPTTPAPTTTATGGLQPGPGTTVEGSPIPTSPLPAGASTTAPPPSIGAPPDDFADLVLEAVEVTQGIQDLRNRMPLVAGRRTWVRVYVESDNPPAFTWPEVDAAVQLARGDQTLVIYPENGPITTKPAGPDRTVVGDTLNFLVPDDWTTAGEVTVRAVTWSYTPSTVLEREPDADNNLRAVSVRFREGKDPELVVVPLDPTPAPGDEPSDATMQAVPSWMSAGLLDFHPIADPVFWVFQQTLAPGPEAQVPGEWDLGVLRVPRRDEPLTRMAWLHALWDLPPFMRLAGVVNASVPTAGYSGWSKGALFSFWTVQSQTTPPHELGHQWGLGHAGCVDADGDGVGDEAKGGALDPTYPNGLPKCSLAPTDPEGYYGFTTYQTPLQAYSNDPASPAAAFPMMSYKSPKWTDPYHYCTLLDAYGVDCSPVAIGVPPKAGPEPGADCEPRSDGGVDLQVCLSDDPGKPEGAARGPVLIAPTEPEEVVAVSGTLSTSSGQATIGEALTVPPPQWFTRYAARTRTDAATRTPSDPAVELVGAGGKVLARAPVDLDGASGHGDGVRGDSIGFFQMLGWREGVTAIRLVRDGQVLTERVAGPNRPTVQLLAPAAGSQYGRDVEVRWRATDADGDRLTAAVQWSADDGRTWRPVGAGIAGDSVRVTDALGLPGGRVRVRVHVSDGVNTAAAVSAPFRVAKGVPRLVVTGPTSPVPRYDVVRLAAHAFDPEDGFLGGGRVRWDQGTGRTVESREYPPGEHRVGVEVADRDGNVVRGEATFVIVDGGRPAPRRQGAVPEAEALFATAAATSGGGGSWWLGPVTVGAGLAIAVAGIVARRRR